ncbi:MAG: divergent PAP2 family protein [Candidatus Woesearchaeota archaeon]
MNVIYSIITNYYFLSFVIAWILSVIIKTGIVALKNRSVPKISEGLQNGGMPSSHSAVVSSITAAIYLMQGLSGTFFVSLVFSLIVISDAFMLRYNVGIQAQELNILLKKSKRNPIKIVHGHTFAQVIGGIILGIAVSTILYFL